ncbi:T9SS type B sorting domain-containing protein [Mangrovimonas yunxiaonensis]|uniref:T9SS type B sorting domain-containing protein n=1 Tax=Mangrovimonas yunxiaonensis TaxID=1197477 RepID=UPI0009FCC772|nr:gliding motility-associated C-terminal domain-containing protein [Mangrovimonas yunxiaonensis]
MRQLKIFFVLITSCLFLSATCLGQEISLYNQFNGRYDYLAIGNTLNAAENNLSTGFCDTLPASSATLNLSDDYNIIAAYLYWAGSGEGDLNIAVNNVDIQAEETYYVDYNDPNYGPLTYFSCFTNITTLILDQGNTSYEISNLDISQALANNPGYCGNRTNFAGWSIYVVYENNNLPLNQINLFQGLEIINRNVQEKNILLENVNVLDNQGAKIGFLTWEGDAALNYGESLFINNNLLSNPPLNPSDNAFNGTNSFTNSNTLYNCDIDYYNIQNYIAIGDTAVNIKLTTGDFNESGGFSADLIIINNIITVLNSQLPDATITLDNYALECGNRNIILTYTVHNANSTDVLPANTPITFYADNTNIGTTQTNSNLAIGTTESGSLQVTIPESLGQEFTIQAIVDDTGNGAGIVTELNETNNTSNPLAVALLTITNTTLPPLAGCDSGYNQTFFNLTAHLMDIEPNGAPFSFYTSLEDLQNNTFEIITPENFQNTTTPQTIYVKSPTQDCYQIFNFNVLVENCPPTIPQVFTPNNDGYNDWFNIQGLYHIFEHHKLLIYNRWGTLIFEGDNDTPWEGRANRGLNNQGDLLPVGTYFYVLYLNDPHYEKSITGWVYLNR